MKIGTSKRKFRQIRATRSPRFTGIALCLAGCCLIVASGQLIGQQAGAESSANTNALAQQQVVSLKPAIPLANKIGQAPHDRPACQLPHISNLRRVQNQLLSAGSSEHQVDEPSSVQLAANVTRPSSSSPAKSTINPFLGPANLPVGLGARAQQLANKRFDSSERLRQLRQLLASNSYDAYLVTPNDEHGNEFVSDYDRRLRFISGFTGSNGYALILLDRAVLFTDGRYALQADQDLDCNWWLVVSDEPLADIPLWLKANAANGLKIATDARLMSLQSFDYLEEHIRRLDSEFALISQDLIDIVWNNNAAGDAPRPKAQDKLSVHPLAFSGNVTWQEKLVRLADSMGKLRARHYIISQLDDVAWLLNLRGNDIPMTPLFKAYLLVSRSPPAESPPSTMTRPASVVAASVDQLLVNSNGRGPQNGQQQQQQPGAGQQATLLAPQVLQVEPSQSIKVTLYVDLKKIDQQIRDHLHVDNGTIIVHHQHQQAARSSLARVDHSSDPALATTSASPMVTSKIQIELKDYDVFIMDIRDKLNPGAGARQLQGRLLLNAGANVAVHVLAKGFEDRLVLVESLVNKLKAVKSDGEVQGMRLAHWRDSLAISMLLAQLELDIGHRGLVDRWSEVSAAQELEFYRSLMDYNRGQSFETISAYGSNGAIVHYAPSHADENPQPIGNTSTYLLDSGGQYLDGTTDITRTTHYGEPSEFQRETYTRVLMGSIDMMSLIFDQPARGAYRLNDMLARRHLFELGLDYAHGTGHGIGLYSLVHEAPALIENYATTTNAKRQQSASKQSALVHSEPVPLQANMFTSVEPGYYKANDFGIRLENIVVTQRVNLPASLMRPNDRQEPDSSKPAGGDRQFLRFEPLSLVPFEPKLIKTELLSNKQKAWLNSYNLMVRYRMTQQINYYLNKILGHQAQPIQVQGTASSSRLYQQLLQQQQHRSPISGQTSVVSSILQVSNNNRSLDLERTGQYNFLRLEGSQLKEKLEMTHRWIMSKTELIPLDVPQSLVAPQPTPTGQQQPGSSVNGGAQTAAGRNSAQANESTRKRSHEAQQSGNLHSQRLMLVYMASLPFNDREASEVAAASLGDSPLGGRMLASGKTADAADSNGSSSSGHLLADGNKCSGFECDLWLLGSLNRATSATQRHNREPDSWLSGGQPDGDSQAARQLGLGSSLLHLFSLNGASDGPTISLPINMWSMLVLGLLVILQLGFASYVCRRHRGSRQASATLCQPQSS